MKAMHLAFRCLILILMFGSVAVESKYASAGIFEYNLCKSRQIPERELQNFIFSCSTVAGDASLPNDIRSDAFFRRGIAYAISHDARAIDDITEAIRLNPIPELYLARSIVLINNGRNKEALQDLDGASNAPLREMSSDFIFYLEPLSTKDPTQAKARIPMGLLLTQTGKDFGMANGVKGKAEFIRDVLSKQRQEQ